MPGAMGTRWGTSKENVAELYEQLEDFVRARERVPTTAEVRYRLSDGAYYRKDKLVGKGYARALRRQEEAEELLLYYWFQLTNREADELLLAPLRDYLLGRGLLDKHQLATEEECD